MDAMEKTAAWIVALAIAFVLVMFGVGVWAIIELITWITSK